MTFFMKSVPAPIRTTAPVQRGWTSLTRIVLVAVLLCVPVALTVTLLTPFIRQKQTAALPPPDAYLLPRDAAASAEDVARIMDRLRMDPAFKYYFRVLPTENIEQAGAELVAMLSGPASGASGLLKTIQDQQSRVESLAAGIMGMDYTSGVSLESVPGQRLAAVLWIFLYEEFKTAVLGACYKSTYDPAFHFQWTAETQQAGLTLRRVFAGLTDQQRQALGATVPPGTSVPAQ